MHTKLLRKPFHIRQNSPVTKLTTQCLDCKKLTGEGVKLFDGRSSIKIVVQIVVCRPKTITLTRKFHLSCFLQQRSFCRRRVFDRSEHLSQRAFSRGFCHGKVSSWGNLSKKDWGLSDSHRVFITVASNVYRYSKFCNRYFYCMDYIIIFLNFLYPR